MVKPMRYLFLSDIHSNIDAFESTLAAADAFGWDRLVVLGDLVGYGGAPNEVVDRVRDLAPYALVRGNHDKVASGLEPADGFNPVARQAVDWTHHVLTSENSRYVALLPEGPALVDDLIEIFHGAPYDEDDYVFERESAERILRQARRQLSLFGHTHVAGYFWWSPTGFGSGAPGPSGHLEVALEPEKRYLVNPGSVGQPRDGDPRAAFAVFDTDAGLLTMKRVAYDVKAAQRRIVEAGLPAALAHRLEFGR
jgi:diadenosine tetraphosphatase ApaH/serine/threonine PP2A family protein phosphatase